MLRPLDRPAAEAGQPTVIGPTHLGFVSLAVMTMPGAHLSLALCQSALQQALEAREAWRQAATILFRQQEAHLKEMQADAVALSRAMLDDIDAATRLQLVWDHLDQAWAKAITRSVAMVEVATRGLNPASASSLPERPVSAPRAGDDLAA